MRQALNGELSLALGESFRGHTILPFLELGPHTSYPSLFRSVIHLDLVVAEETALAGTKDPSLRDSGICHLLHENWYLVSHPRQIPPQNRLEALVETVISFIFAHE